MKALFVILSLFVAACQSVPSVPRQGCSHFQGQALTMPYHVIIGETLSTDQKKEVLAIVERTFREIDEIFNIYNPSSEISRLNAAPSNAYYALSAPLEETLAFCDKIVQLSGHRFDPTIEPLFRLWKEGINVSRAPSNRSTKNTLGCNRLAACLLEKRIISKRQSPHPN